MPAVGFSIPVYIFGSYVSKVDFRIVPGAVPKTPSLISIVDEPNKPKIIVVSDEPNKPKIIVTKDEPNKPKLVNIETRG